MTDSEVQAYLQSHAPLEKFYLFEPMHGDGGSIMYFDEDARPWIIMEDDEAICTRVCEFLKQAGARVFNDHPSLSAYEAEIARSQSARN